MILEEVIIDTIKENKLPRMTAWHIAKHTNELASSISAICSVMFKKGILQREHDGKAYIYSLPEKGAKT